MQVPWDEHFVFSFFLYSLQFYCCTICVWIKLNVIACIGWRVLYFVPEHIWLGTWNTVSISGLVMILVPFGHLINEYNTLSLVPPIFCNFSMMTHLVMVAAPIVACPLCCRNIVSQGCSSWHWHKAKHEFQCYAGVFAPILFSSPYCLCIKHVFITAASKIES